MPCWGESLLHQSNRLYQKTNLFRRRIPVNQLFPVVAISTCVLLCCCMYMYHISSNKRRPYSNTGGIKGSIANKHRASISRCQVGSGQFGGDAGGIKGSKANKHRASISRRRVGSGQLGGMAESTCTAW